MTCNISGEQLWSWIDRDAPELEEHLATCPSCRNRAARMREDIGLLASGAAIEYSVPERIGPYRITRVLGEGGQAIVFEAEQPSPQRLVALKVLKGGSLIGKNRLKQFRREAHTLGRLHHPGIATIYEAGRSEDGMYYFAMELVEGMPLHSYVTAQGLDTQRILDLFQKVCAAVQYAHESGVVHRDLKPSNILIDRNGEPRILDFGLARLTEKDILWSATTTADGRVEGTPRYMSPEQALGATSKIDRRSDVYALGVILYELLTGKPPHQIDSFTPDSLHAIKDEIPSRPSKIDSSLSGDIDAIMLKALEKDPDRRYQSVADMVDDITRYCSGLPIGARSPSAFYYVRKKLFKRNAGIALGIVAVAAVAIMLIPRGESPYDSMRDRLMMLDLKFKVIEDSASPVVFDQAIHAREQYPHILEAILVGAHEYASMNYLQSATFLLNGAIENDPSCWSCRELLNAIQNEGGINPDTTSEQSVWNGKLARSADAWYLRSWTTRDVKQSLEYAKAALRIDHQHRLALVTIAELARITGDRELALGTAQILIDHGYRVSKWRRFRIHLLLEMNRPADALAECHEVIENNPEGQFGYNLTARIERLQGNYREAERNFSIAIEKSGGNIPETAWLLFHRGTVRLLLDDRDGAISDYRLASRWLPDPSFGTARLYLLLQERGDSSEAEAVLERARTNPRLDPWLKTILDCLAGDIPPGVLGAMAKSSKNPITCCEGCYYAGEVCFLEAREAEARKWFEQARDTGVAVDPQNPLEAVSEYELATHRLILIKKREDAQASRGSF